MSDRNEHTDPANAGDPAAAAVEAVRALAEDREALERLWKKEETLLTLQDVLERVPWSRPTVLKMIKKREIPMIKKRGKWVITRRAYRQAAERGFEAPKNVRTYSG